MPISSFQNPTTIGQDGSPEVSPIYVYIIKPNDARDTVFLTSYQENLTIDNLPASFDAASSQEFDSVQVSHGEIAMSSDFERQSFTLDLPYDSTYLNELIVVMSSIGMTVSILRIAGGDLSAASAIDYDEDCYIVQSGQLEDFSISGDAIRLNCAPQALHSSLSVPRLWFSRSCQHALYGPACRLTKATFQKTGTLTPIDDRLRTVSVASVAGTLDADYFTSGTLLHVDSGEEFSILVCAHDNGTGVASLTLAHYSEQFNQDDDVELYPGCRHTVDDCTAKFSNTINFGGFPKIPNRNPTIHSA
tara:strand:- start:51388 stop:52299 length:912 start_codon:yes stop_codon:yes gene_type:complete